MPQYNFGVGTMVARRTDVSNPTPVLLGVLQDVSLDIDQSVKELMGQYKMPVDVAPAGLKVAGKAKFARIQANAMNDLLLGQTLTAGAGQDMATSETHAVPSPSGPYTVTATNGSTFKEDLGVFYSNGQQLTRVAPGSEATGSYSVVETTGVYTFAAGDAAKVLSFFYSFGVTTLKQITLTNQLMGAGTTFELNLSEKYTSAAGTAGTMFIKLNACRSTKLSLPFKNTDYTIQELDFQAFADSSNNWGIIATSE